MPKQNFNRYTKYLLVFGTRSFGDPQILWDEFWDDYIDHIDWIKRANH